MKHQPTADQFREQLALAADRIIEQDSGIEWRDEVIDRQLKMLARMVKHRWWHRFAWWRK